MFGIHSGQSVNFSSLATFKRTIGCVDFCIFLQYSQSVSQSVS